MGTKYLPTNQDRKNGQRFLSQQRIQDVPPVQLANGDQIQRRDENADPTGK